MGKKNIDFWSEISKEINRDVYETKKKMESFLGSFRRERQREISGRSEAGTDQVYCGNLCGKMKFLKDKFQPRITKNTIDVRKFYLLLYIATLNTKHYVNIKNDTILYSRYAHKKYRILC